MDTTDGKENFWMQKISFPSSVHDYNLRFSMKKREKNILNVLKNKLFLYDEICYEDAGESCLLAAFVELICCLLCKTSM